MKIENETLKEKHERQIARARGTSGYFIFYRDFGKFLSKTEALFLQDLINRREMAYIRSLERMEYGKKPLIDDKNYFQCTVKYLANPKYLVWSVVEQRRLVRSLVKKGFIKIDKKGMPSTRWVWINFPLIEDTLDKIEIVSKQ